MTKNYLKIGLFGIGLETYWQQFEGLEQRLSGYVDHVEQRLAGFGAEVVNLGLIDTTDKAFEAGHAFRQADVDLIFLYVTTYALSSTVLPVVRRAKVPVIVLNLAPDAHIDYESFNAMDNRTQMTGEWLAWCSACPVPEIANVFKRSNISFYQVTGTLYDDPIAWQTIEDWISAARVAHAMEHNTLGIMGNYYGGMLDIYSNLTLQCATFGGHIEVIEVDELSALGAGVTEEELISKQAEFRRVFDIQEDCSDYELMCAAKTAVALDQLVDKYQLGSLAYYHKGTGNPQNQESIRSIILGNSLLTANGVPVAGEYEIKNAQAMKIMDSFGAGGSFTEYYAMDFKDDVVLMGHDGPCHIGIAEGKIKVKPLKEFHGKVGSGLSVEMSVKYGDVTLLSVVETADGKIVFLVAEAESVPGPILEIGNTNSRYRFKNGARNFVESWNAEGPAHHCAIGTGHIASKISKLGELIGVKTIVIR
ncbi:arabinose isomerase [Pedobacter metabolipauper]|uniref:L-arabinose isomerase n=1 Tax=Pedobacter metabolipauper TaxID=425513 RepID=A0A4R6SSV2_9SPHI|nr:arabinose isomerase [Pedobacter metabolipauper]TDQ06945.1 L-arabinose isomerase [Pedobacter metabolipauper]